MRTALVAGTALVFVASLATSADAAVRKRVRSYAKPPALSAVAVAKKPNPEKDGFVDIPKAGVLQIAISIGSQRLSLYRDGVRVATSPVSTGTASHPTPTGVFSVIEKDRWHRSNLYGNAPMFFMQRVTWSGVAMHEGVLPGYAASHGCIRLPREFAARLWPTTRLGARVVIARGEVAPVEFKHPTLFVPAPKPAEPRVAGIEPTKPMRFAEASTIANDAAAALPADKPAATAADEPTPAAPVADAPKPGDVAAAESKPEDGKTEPAQAAAPADDAVTSTGAIVPMPAEAPSPSLSNELRKAVEAPQPAPAAPAATPAPTPAAAPASSDPEKPAPSLIDPLKPTAPRTKAAEQPPKRTGQVAVFVSRKEKKIFVRQGFIPVFEMPITITNPDQPLGTHVFTAMALTDSGAGMRWNLITMPTSGLPAPQKSSKRSADKRKQPKVQPVVVVDTRPPSSAAEALDRIQMPKEAVERISELLIPGSSLVVSDEGLGRETGRYTEFIVLTR